MPDPEETSAASTRTLEIVVGVALLAFALVVMWDSKRIGAGWGSNGPESGYFPFYIGLLMAIACVINLVQAWRAGNAESFVSKIEIKLVAAMFVPAMIFVFAMQWLGIYVAGALLIAIFMRWQGKFTWLLCATVALGTSLTLFVMFEIWFQVPLLKGPLEAALGF